MAEKLTHAVTIKMTEAQHRALQLRAEQKGLFHLNTCAASLMEICRPLGTNTKRLLPSSAKEQPPSRENQETWGGDA